MPTIDLKEKLTSRKASGLFDVLRKLRYTIAKEEEVPAYVIFSDATLRQLETERPISEAEFLSIEGVGKVKLEKYGTAFIDAIITFQKDKPVLKKKENNTYKETLLLYNAKNSVEEIAAKRKLGVSTIISHIAKLHTDGQISDVSDFITAAEIEAIKKAKKAIEPTTALKPYFDYFEEKIDYGKIRLALAILEKENTAL